MLRPRTMLQRTGRAHFESRCERASRPSLRVCARTTTCDSLDICASLDICTRTRQNLRQVHVASSAPLRVALPVPLRFALSALQQRELSQH